jgi:hypothetical protein
MKTLHEIISDEIAHAKAEGEPDEEELIDAVTAAVLKRLADDAEERGTNDEADEDDDQAGDDDSDEADYARLNSEAAAKARADAIADVLPSLRIRWGR